jgi:hypothetical protein
LKWRKRGALAMSFDGVDGISMQKDGPHGIK